MALLIVAMWLIDRATGTDVAQNRANRLFVAAGWFVAGSAGLWLRRLRVGPHGIALVNASGAWADAVTIERRWCELRRHDVLLLRHSLFRKIPLTAFDPDWRTGPIGDDLRRWCPRLLD